MDFTRSWRSAPRRVWLIIAVVLMLVVAGGAAAIAFAVSASDAAERAAAEDAERAAAERADQAAAVRLASAQEDASDGVVQGEALFGDSEAWADNDARANLRVALDALAETQSDAGAIAEDLESAINVLTMAMVAVGEPPAPVRLICGNLDAGVDFTVHPVVLRPDGSGEYSDLWAAQLRCDTGMRIGGSPVNESVAVQTPLQKAAVAAAKEAGYADYNDTDAEILYAVYDGCAQAGSGSYYSDATALSESQAKEVMAFLTLCFDHPDAENWRVAIGGGEAVREAEANGTRVAPGGSYEIPSQMAYGTFVAEGVKDCYWETRDAHGNIVANNFVIAAPRVVAEVGSEAVVFTTNGGCGYWNRQ